MGRVFRFGCFGLIGIVVLLVALALLAPKPPPPQPTISGQPASTATGGAPAVAQVGQTASLGGCEVTLLDFGPYERFATLPPPTPAQGKRMVADMRIKNLQTSTSNFTTSDFELKAADGRSFKPDGTTATIERGFVIS